MPVTVQGQFRKESTCSYAGVFQAKHVHFNSEADWSRAKMEGEIGAIWGKHESGQLASGDYFRRQVGGVDDVISYEKGKGFSLNKSTTLADGRVSKFKAEIKAKGELHGWVISGRFRRVGQPAPPVSPRSDSQGVLSDEDTAILFVKSKDDLAKSRGLPMQGANPALDREVIDSIARHTGFTPDEVQAKLDAYRATGKKLSALKKRVLASDKTYDEALKRTAKKNFDPPSPIPGKPKSPGPDIPIPPKPTEDLKDEIVKDVEKKAKSGIDPVDEDIVKAYVKAKEHLASDPANGFTVFSSGPDLERAIERLVREWGMDISAEDIMAATKRYVASGKKISALKKSMISRGEMAVDPASKVKKKAVAEVVKQKTDQDYANEHLDGLLFGPDSKWNDQEDIRNFQKAKASGRLVSGVTEKTVKEVTERELRSQAQITPNVMMRLRSVRNYNDSSYTPSAQTLAYYHPAHYEMTMLSAMIDSGADSAIRKSLGSGWFSECKHGAGENIVAHEFGHHVHAQWFDASASFEAKEMRALSRAVKEEFDFDMNVKKSVANRDSMEGIKKRTVHREVSQYASTNDSEFLAEVWAEYTTNPNPRPKIARIGRAMEELSEAIAKRKLVELADYQQKLEADRKAREVI